MDFPSLLLKLDWKKQALRPPRSWTFEPSPCETLSLRCNTDTYTYSLTFNPGGPTALVSAAYSRAPDSPAALHRSLFTRKQPGFTGSTEAKVFPSHVSVGGMGGIWGHPTNVRPRTPTQWPARLLWRTPVLVDVRSDLDLTKGLNNS